ncbi:MAG: class B sortase [Erysipelotrichaceae bacterium]|nr:class B sortase [Erysipelotrichaceae bacterium]
MNKTQKKILLLSLAVIAVSSLVLSAVFHKPAAPEPVPETETAVPEKKITVAEYYDWSSEQFRENKAVNGDYIGTLRFESGLIDQPIVQGETNDTYLRTDWKTGDYALGGTCFLDYSIRYEKTDEAPEDHNIVIYGHYMYPEYDPSRTEMFTPLHTLRSEDNYETNKYIVLLQEDQVRRYQVADVYLCRLEYDDYYKDYVYTADQQQYYLGNFTPEYLEAYKDTISVSVNDPSLNVDNEGTGYDATFTGVDFDADDSILTLQTCVLNRADLRLIVVAKEIGRMKLTDVFE